MYRHLMTLLLAAVIAGSAWSQETDSQEDETEETSAEVAAQDDAEIAEQDITDVAEQDDAELDDQTFTGAEDDFVPSEDIPADQSIAFPTDI